MKIRISITIDEAETIDLLTTERGELQAGELGVQLGRGEVASGERAKDADRRSSRDARAKPEVRDVRRVPPPQWPQRDRRANAVR
jgi:hypothetical protein